PPATNPRAPPACVQSFGSSGAPPKMCRLPCTQAPSRRLPRTICGRACGLCSVRISTIAAPSSTRGSAMAAEPMMNRTTQSNQWPTGPPACHHTPAAAMTASPRYSRARPSRRWAGSIYLVLPTARTTVPTPRARLELPARDRRGLVREPERLRVLLRVFAGPRVFAVDLLLLVLRVRVEPVPRFVVRLAMLDTVAGAVPSVTPATAMCCDFPAP